MPSVGGGELSDFKNWKSCASSAIFPFENKRWVGGIYSNSSHGKTAFPEHVELANSHVLLSLDPAK